MASPLANKRREMDVMKLLMSDWKVELVNESTKELEVEFKGPSGSPYEGGIWKVRVEIPDSYPYKSPSIGFKNRIYHPNVDEAAGSVCLDVINQTWSPLFELVNVFEVFLPQLLLYPNPTDPLNGEAAAMLLREPESFNKKVREYVKKYATQPCNSSTPKAPDEAPSFGQRKSAEHNNHSGACTGDAPASSAPATANVDDQACSGSDDDDDNLVGMLSDSDADD